MNNKINFQDLVASFAQHNDVTKKTAETFLRTLFDIVQEYAVSDGQVKIKGFGTFKIVEVESRESVNVNTGERVLIEGHAKMTFTPDATLRDQVNKPFADFSTVILNPNTPLDEMETIEKEEEQEEMMESVVEESTAEKNTTAELEPQDEEDEKADMVNDNTSASEPEAEETTTPTVENLQEDVQPVEESARRGGPRRKILEPKHDDSEEDMPMTEQTPVNHIAHQTIEQMNIGSQYVANQTIQQMVANAVKEEMKQRGGVVLSKRLVGTLIALILVLLTCMFLIGYHVGFRKTTVPARVVPVQEQAAKPAPKPVVKPTVVKQPSVEKKNQQQTQPEVKVQDKVAELKKQAAKYEQLVNGEYLIVGEKEPHIMARGDNMYRIARKAYGNYRLADYIIHFNKFRNPDVVSPGTKVRLPELVKKNELR